MAIPWRKLLTKVGKWLVRKGAEEALKEIQKRKDKKEFEGSRGAGNRASTAAARGCSLVAPQLL
jgi:hypothetical protein